MPESAGSLDDGKRRTHASIHSHSTHNTVQTWIVTSARAAGEEKFWAEAPVFTLVSGLFSGPRLRRAVVS